MDNLRQLLQECGAEPRVADGLEELYRRLGSTSDAGDTDSHHLARRDLVFTCLLGSLRERDTRHMVLYGLSNWRGTDLGTLLASVFNILTPPAIGPSRLAPDPGLGLFRDWRELHAWKGSQCRRLRALGAPVGSVR